MGKKNETQKNKLNTQDLGFISSMGGDTRNGDYFNIFSKSALFDYDSAKKIYEYCKSLAKKKQFAFLDGHYQLKKRKILTQDWYMDEIGNSISIKKINVPKLGEGIAYASSFELFGGDAWWLKSSFLKNFIKFEKYSIDHIDVDDNTLCFGFFDMNIEIGFDEYNKLDFFKIKNKENKNKFNEYIKDKYKKILSKRNMGGKNVIECKVSNGKHIFYNMILTKTIPGSVVEKGQAVGQILICQKK